MSGFDGIRRVFRLGIGGGDADREVERELEHHFAATVEELIARGRPASEARAEAARRFGDERRYRRELRRLARGRDRRERASWTLGAGGRAVADALRGIGRAPGLSLGVVLVIGLGVGVNATMFGMLDRLFLRAPDHVEDADEVRRLFVTRRGFNGDIFTARFHTYPDYRDWKELDAFSSVAAFSERSLTVGQGEEAESRSVTLATHELMPLLGARTAVGRWFSAEDDAFGAEKVAVLGHSFWRARFGGDESVLGRPVDVGGDSYTVVGVAPAGFTGVGLERVDVWLPLHPGGEVEEGGREWVESRGWYWFEVVGRLAPGVTPEAATEAATVAHRRGRAEQETYDREARVTAEPLLLARTSLASEEARVVPWLTGVAGMVLLLTCANVANLLLARGVQRRRDAAVRLALGAGRGRLIGSSVLEAVLLALMGGAAAYLLAAGAGDLLRSFLLPTVGWAEGSDRGRILLFSGALAVIAGLLAGTVPAVRA
ncbi:MAG: ABC transporter permease, partial [Gemmatimonadetes bacterium]|nr:ABC transporter permease [Gemmatimonadota bacterium]